MEYNSNMGKINRAAVYDKLQDLAEKYLTGFQEAYLNMFVSEAKRLADNALDDFIHAQEMVYTSDPLCGIKDRAKLLAFTDAQAGYRRQMQEWIKDNPIEVAKQTVSSDDLPEDIPLGEREAFKHSMSTFGLGTLAVAGLRIATGLKWIWIAEIGTFAASSKAYKSGKEVDDRKRKQFQETWVKSERQNVIASIKHDLNSWFDSAEKESNRILISFNVE